MEAIRERVSQLSLAGARVDLTEGSVDAQRSGINGELNSVCIYQFIQTYECIYICINMNINLCLEMYYPVEDTYMIYIYIYINSYKHTNKVTT
jgi:hypothetical protein